MLVEIPFDDIAPDKRKFYIHRRQSESSLSNWDRWSRDWVWTLDELMGLAIDKAAAPSVKQRRTRKDVSYEMEDMEDEEDGEVMAVLEGDEVLPVGTNNSPKHVVQRYWLGECIQQGRVLDRDAGWHVDCVEGWQYPQWDTSNVGKAPVPWGEERLRKMVGETEERWTWGVREDEYGFGFGWRKEVKRVVSDPLPVSTLPSATTLRGTPMYPDRPRLTLEEIREQDDINRRMNDNRRFSISRKGDLLWDNARPSYRSVSMPMPRRYSTSSSRGGSSYRPRYSPLENDAHRRRESDEYNRESRPRSPGHQSRAAAWGHCRRSPSPPSFRVGRDPALQSSKHHDLMASQQSQKKRKGGNTQPVPTDKRVPQIFRGVTFNNFQPSSTGFVNRLRSVGGRFTDIKGADYVILPIDPGRTSQASYVSAIKRNNRRPRKPNSEVVSVQWIEHSISAGRRLGFAPYLITAGPNPPASQKAASKKKRAKDSRKRDRPKTPEVNPGHGSESTSQVPISVDPQPDTGSASQAPGENHAETGAPSAPSPHVEQQPTPPPDQDQILDFEDALIDLEYDDDNDMMVDLDVHLNVPSSYDWSKTPKIDLPPGVMNTHVDAVRILITELKIWDGEGTKSECLDRIKQKVG